jgi:hypothetical protein
MTGDGKRRKGHGVQQHPHERFRGSFGPKGIPIQANQDECYRRHRDNLNESRPLAPRHLKRSQRMGMTGSLGRDDLGGSSIANFLESPFPES